MEETNKPLKYDNGKLRWDLLPIEVIEDIVKIMTFGANKYSDNGWKQIEGKKDIERYYAALMRHLVEFRKGNIKDDESGESHLAHALTNLVFLLWFEKNECRSDV